MTQDIKELLELAALACGIDACAVGDYGVDDDGLWLKGGRTEDNHKYWAPHMNDGDGARMETQLGIGLHRLRQVVEAFVDRDSPTSEMYYDPEITWSEHYADHNGNRQAARRMASLRVAAEIWRRMKT